MAGREGYGRRTSVQNQLENRPGLREAGEGVQNEQGPGSAGPAPTQSPMWQVEDASPPSR